MTIQLQYIIVSVILAAAVAWIIYRLVRKKPDGGGACAGCSLSDACSKRGRQRRPDDKCRRGED